MAAAALLWTVVGAGLLAAGIRFASPAGWGRAAVSILGGVAAGLLKGRLLLAGMAGRNAARIRSGAESRALTDLFAPSSWLLALAFVSAGAAIRRIGLPPQVLGFVYVAAGFGLLSASLSAWRAWFLFRCEMTNS